jgi:hypothetical protein
MQYPRVGIRSKNAAPSTCWSGQERLDRLCTDDGHNSNSLGTVRSTVVLHPKLSGIELDETTRGTYFIKKSNSERRSSAFRVKRLGHFHLLLRLRMKLNLLHPECLVFVSSIVSKASRPITSGHRQPRTPTRRQLPLRASHGAIPTMHRIGLCCPCECHGGCVAAVKYSEARIGVERHSTAAPINILMIEVKAPPCPLRSTVNEAGRERFATPITLLHDAHLGPIRGHGTANDPRGADVIKKPTPGAHQSGRRRNQQHPTSSSHQLGRNNLMFLRPTTL